MSVVRNVAVAIVILALASAGAAEAREPLLNQMLNGSGEWLHVNLVGGRLTLKATQLPNFERRFSSGGVKEHFRFRYDNGQPSLSYERTTREERLTLSLNGSGESVRIRREPRENSAVVAVEFKQSPKEKTVLTIGSGDRQEVFRAGDLWRLLLAQPKQCQEHLFPLLAMLRPDLKFAEMVPSVEQHLLDGARENPAAAQAHWSALVEQLGDDCFAKREAADRALRTGGAAALRFLRHLDFERLDAEQQFRVRRIIESLAGIHEDDSPEEVAASLAADPAVWLSLLGRPEVSTRRIAAVQLASLLGEALKVDPTAEPDTLKQQRDRLRTRIEKEQSGVGTDGKKTEG